ncbi:MAG: hypothetical protein KAS72_07525 [Phycisphaerales bacterium]|nr:hypothetical protein [Phycisphaerales bacterium]
MCRPIRLILVAIIAASAGCGHVLYDQPTRPYPEDTRQSRVADVQVFRDGPTITLVSATGESFQDVSLWLNQRYMQHITALPAGAQLTLDLFDFRDDAGEAFRGGGFFAGYDPDRLVTAQIELTDGELVGLLVIPPRVEGE